jgi:hypothetical protein
VPDRSLVATAELAAVPVPVAVDQVLLQPTEPDPSPTPTTAPERFTQPSQTAATSLASQPSTPAASVSPSPPRISVRAHGARGDGAADDTSAFRAAASAAGPGSLLFVPAGTYLIAQLVLDVAGQDWLLDPAARLQLRNGANSDLVVIVANDVRIRGGRFDGSRTHQASSGTCIVIRGHRVRLDDVEVANCRGWGVFLGGTNETRIEGSRIHDTTGAAIFGHAASYSVIHENTIERTSDPSAGGIVFHGDGVGFPSIGNSITRNRVAHTAQIAIEVWGLAPESRIADNITSGGSMGISVNRSDRSVVSRNVVSWGPWNPSEPWIGIEIAETKNVEISANTIDGNGAQNTTGVAASSIDPNSLPTDNSVIHNRIVRTWRAMFFGAAHRTRVAHNEIDGYSGHGIEIHSDDMLVTSNLIANGGTPDATGVIIDNSNGSTIDANTIRRCGRAVSLYQAGAGTVNRNHITNNRFEHCSTGIVVYGRPASDNVIEGNTSFN